MGFRAVRAVGDAIAAGTVSATPAEALTLITVAHAADDDNGLAWPSVATIAARTGLGASTVRTALRTLVHRGVLEADAIPPVREPGDGQDLDAAAAARYARIPRGQRSRAYRVIPHRVTVTDHPAADPTGTEPTEPVRQPSTAAGRAAARAIYARAAGG